nr:biotin transporter BioY [Bacilli bacterium]
MSTSYLSVRAVVYTVLFSAIFSVFSFANISLPFTPVPITMATMAIMLAGAMLGALYGTISILLIIILSLLGLPLLAGANGLALLIDPSGGFVWIWPVCALLIGLFLHNIKGTGWKTYLYTFIILEVFGSWIMYVTGVPWLAHSLHISLSKALILGCYPYLPGDTIKAIIATLIVVPMRNYFPLRRLLSTTTKNVVQRS